MLEGIDAGSWSHQILGDPKSLAAHARMLHDAFALQVAIFLCVSRLLSEARTALALSVM